MEISLGLEIVKTALWIKKNQVLIINDLHLGYEEALQQRGILVPHFQFQEILQKLCEVLKKVSPRLVIINGDLKHEFGTILPQEWREILGLFDFFLQRKIEIIIIQGNHDSIVKPIAERRGVQIKKEYRYQDILVIHGNELITTTAKKIIIGHEHPAITIREGSKWEKYKCFLRGKWQRKELIVVPSFNPLLEGTDVLQEELLSPFLKDIGEFTVYVVSGGDAFNFGRVKDLK